MRRSAWRRTVMVVTATMVCAMVAAPFSRAADATASTSTLQWNPCAGEAGGLGLECAEVTVPADWDSPGGELLDIAVSRRPADDPGRRLGVLLVNPGGPGGSGLTMPAQIPTLASPQVAERFDVIGFDPRGVGASHSISCAVTIETAVPESPQEYQDVLDTKRAEGEACAQENPLLPYVDTVSAAHDIDAIRTALGEERINWLGFSYGTQLGATYAELYPDRVRAMALDAMANHQYDLTEPGAAGLTPIQEQAVAREIAFSRFSDWCGSEPDCLIGHEDVGRTFDELVARAADDPLQAPDRPDGVNDDMIVDATAALLSSPQYTWPSLGEAIEAGVAGDGSGFAAMFEEAEPGQTTAPMIAVRCLDWPSDPADQDFERVRRAAGVTSALAPRFGAHSEWYYRAECASWPIAATNPPDRWNIETDGAILVIGALFDPATPYPWAVQAAQAIPGADLLTFTGDGHGAAGSSECVRTTMVDHLVDPTARITLWCGQPDF